MFREYGLDCYWLLREALSATPENVERVEAALRKLADVLAGDISCKCTRLMRLPGSHNTKIGSSIPVKVTKQRKGRHSLERMESWLATAKPVLHRYKHTLGAEQYYWRQRIIQDFRQSDVASDQSLATEADPMDRWADEDQQRRWAEAEEADDDDLWAEFDRY